MAGHCPSDGRPWKPAEINAILKDIAAKSSIEEFWIADSKGHAYLTNTGIDFTFTPNPGKQPQAASFWPLIGGTMTVVTQPPRKRDDDERVFKYVASRASTRSASCRSESPPNRWCRPANRPC